MIGCTPLSCLALAVWSGESFTFEVWRPGAIWLVIPAVVIWWWWAVRARRTVPVGTTFLWERVASARRVTRSTWLLCLLLLLVAAALRPMAWRGTWSLPPELPRVQARHTTPGSEPTLEVILPPGTQTLLLEVRAGHSTIAREALALHETETSIRTFPIPARPDLSRLSVRLGDDVFELQTPVLEPITVRDTSQCEAMQDALTALADLGWVKQIESPTVTVDVAILRDSDGSSSSTARDPHALSAVRLPAAGANKSRLLTRPMPGRSPHPWIAGLVAERWTIALASPATTADEEVVLAASDGPLVTRTDHHARLAFDPTDTDLPESGVWPVFVARMLEDLARAADVPPPNAAVITGRRRIATPRGWPTALLLLGATSLAATLTSGSRRWFVVSLMVGTGVAAMMIPPRIGADSRRVVVVDSPDARNSSLGPAARILAAAEGAPPGSRVSVPRMLPAPVEVEALQALFERRRLQITWNDESPRYGPGLVPGLSLTGVPGRTPLHQELTISCSSTAAAGDWRAAGPSSPHDTAAAPDDRALSVTAIAHSPVGTRTAIASTANEPSALTGSHRPAQKGHWHYTIEHGTNEFARVLAGATTWVEGPIPVLVVGSRESTPPYFDPDQFAVEVLDLERVAAEGIASQLPTPAEYGAVVWQRADPARLPVNAIADLAHWIETGGTLFVSAGELLVEPSPSSLALDALLPARLPDPARDREVDLGVVLIDISGSLRAAQRDLVETAQTLLRGTPEGGRWSVAAFQDRAWWLAAPRSRSTDDLVRRVDELRAGGGTNLGAALEFVTSAFANDAGVDRASRDRSLVLVSDGRAPTTQDELTKYGERLAALGVRILVLAVGDEPDEARLRALTIANGGSYRRTPDADTAATALAEAMQKQPGPWEPLRGELRLVSLDPIVAMAPGVIPAPTRRVALEEVRATGRTLWADDTNSPVLLLCHRGRGRVLLYASGWDEISAPRGRAGSTLARALGTVIAGSTRTQPSAARRGSRRIDARGRMWACFPRERAEAATDRRAVVMAPDVDAEPIPLEPTAHDWRAPISAVGAADLEARAWAMVAHARGNGPSPSSGAVGPLAWLSPGPAEPISWVMPTTAARARSPIDLDLILLSFVIAVALWPKPSGSRDS